MSESGSRFKLMMRLFRYAKPYWGLIVSALLFGGLFSVATNAFAYLVKFLFDNVWKDGVDPVQKWDNLVLVIKGGIALTLGIFVFGFIREYVSDRITWRVVVDLRNSVFRHLLRMSLSFFERRQVGDLMSRVTNDITYTQRALQFLYGNLVHQPLMIIGALAFALYLSPQLFLIAFVIVPILIIPMRTLGKKIWKAGKGGLKKMAELTESMHQIFSGIKIVKAFRMEEREAQSFEKNNEKFFDVTMKGVRARSISHSITDLVTYGGALAVAGLGTYLCFNGTWGLTFGTLSGFMVASSFVYRPIKNLVKAYNVLQECSAGAERIFGLLSEPPEIVNAEGAVAPDAIRGEIKFDGVSFTYGQDDVLHDISFMASPGEMVALVGLSGAGKTTILNLIPRFYEAHTGKILIDGHDVVKIRQESLLDNIAIVTQEPFLFNDTVLHNIAYGRPGASFEEIKEAARAANVHHVIEGLEHGYDTVVGERGAKLSGGEKQRVTVARAILRDAPVLLLDEATSSLDSESEKLVQTALDNLMKNRTTLVIAHRLSTVMHADKIIVLDKGAVVETGTHSELLAKKGVYSRLHELQFKSDK